ncbi:hypothetical protein AU106_gp201 [Sinorhizobium phage phiM9]|uniref:Uncharacterized protein n=1 Tax=Sinorhizobium phage phiM9 TaxID=1636182 RepID=A0A0F6R539_9CAUD|nr:hypothetical protein AU106_gp201 [Sinorhizobium phage phiM9]AKE44832.1 hypothetical protein Sm_phiM9_205 [Sinorhizobium phage phiM9]
MTSISGLIIRSDTERQEDITVKKQVRTIQFDITEEFVKAAIVNEIKDRMPEMKGSRVKVDLDVVPGAISYYVKARATAKFIKD